MAVRACWERGALPPTGGRWSYLFCIILYMRRRPLKGGFPPYFLLFSSFLWGGGGLYCFFGVAFHGHNHLSWWALTDIHSDIRMFLASCNWHFFSIYSFRILNKLCHFFLIFVWHFHIFDMPHHSKFSPVRSLVYNSGFVWVYEKPVCSQLFWQFPLI